MHETHFWSFALQHEMKEEGGSASKAGATADVPLPNSSARKTLLDPYHDLASSIFDIADTPEMENTFLDAAKVWMPLARSVNILIQAPETDCVCLASWLLTMPSDIHQPYFVI